MTVGRAVPLSVAGHGNNSTRQLLASYEERVSDLFNLSNRPDRTASRHQYSTGHRRPEQEDGLLPSVYIARLSAG